MPDQSPRPPGSHGDRLIHYSANHWPIDYVKNKIDDHSWRKVGPRHMVGDDIIQG